MGITTPRTYLCWIKGRRHSTEQSITVTDGRGRFYALLTFAGRHGLKTFECDAVWDRKREG